MIIIVHIFDVLLLNNVYFDKILTKKVGCHDIYWIKEKVPNRLGNTFVGKIIQAGDGETLSIHTGDDLEVEIKPRRRFFSFSKLSKSPSPRQVLNFMPLDYIHISLSPYQTRAWKLSFCWKLIFRWKSPKFFFRTFES